MKNSQKILYVLVTAVFLLTATNALFLPHLLSDDEHQHENCHICKQAAINKDNAILSSPAKICSANKIIYTISKIKTSPLQTERSRLPRLRAPPSIS